MIGIIDYGVGNVGSILNMFRRLSKPARVISVPDELIDVSHVVLPGVGAFDVAMERLEASGFIPALARVRDAGDKPILGICLGMQLLTEGSDEGARLGLGWLPGRAIRFEADRTDLRVPHMGWNTVTPRRADSLFSELDPDHGFYFVHSYHVRLSDEGDILATTDYGEPFVSAVQRGRVYGTQFHPEKSHRHGLRLLSNFAELG